MSLSKQAAETSSVRKPGFQPLKIAPALSSRSPSSLIDNGPQASLNQELQVTG